MNQAIVTQDGWRLELRPIRAEDEALWLELMRSMSWGTRYKRGARRVEQLTPEDVRRAVNPDPHSELAFVAVAARGDVRSMAGVARGTLRDAYTCEFMLVVADAWQKRGLGTRLMQALMDEAARRGHPRIVGRVLATNGNMLDFVRALGFEVQDQPDTPAVKRVVRLHEQAARPAA
jgi:acetyltransferase